MRKRHHASKFHCQPGFGTMRMLAKTPQNLDLYLEMI